MTITIREVAKAAGVSQATAARALSGYGSVSKSSLDSVLSAADKLGYRTNRIAQALRLGQTKTVGFIPGDLENPFFATVARHLGDALEQEGYTLLVSSSDERPDRERRIIETLRTHLVSAFVIAPSSGGDAKHLRDLVKAEVPLVLIDRLASGLEADSVTVDNWASARQAVEHLHALGHRHIAMLSDNLEIDSSINRVKGYRDAVNEFGLTPASADVVFAEDSSNGAFEAALRMLRQEPRPTAMFAGDNVMTLGILRASTELGLTIPDELAVVAFDDFDLAAAIRPTISAIAQPVAEMGVRAAALLLERIHGHRGPARHEKLLTQLIIRESSGSALG